MILQLKEKNICYVINTFFTEAYFTTLRDLSIDFKAHSYQPDDLVNFTITPDLLINTVTQLGSRSEMMTAAIHAELKQTIIAQLTAMTQGTDQTIAAEAVQVLTFFQQKSTEIDTWINGEINSGRTKLLQ